MAKTSRKEERKAARKLKKAKRFAFASKQPLKDILISSGSIKEPKKGGRKKSKKGRKKKEQDLAEQKKVEEIRKKQERRLIEDEEKDERRYARKLGLHRRRNKASLPQTFLDAGLDYILDVCGRRKKDEKVKSSLKGDGGQDGGHHPPQSDPESSDEMESEEIGEETEVNVQPASSFQPRTDIYGRDLDSQGILLNASESARMGALKKLRDLEEAESQGTEGPRLKKLITRIINRLNEQTLVSGAREVGELYEGNRRSVVRGILSESLLRVLRADYELPPRLTLEYAALISLIHSNVSQELSGYLVEDVGRKFRDSVEAGEGEENTNFSALFAHLFRFKADPGGVKELIEAAQRKVGEKETRVEGWRVRFMLETLMAIKNNNTLKLSAVADQSLLEHFGKLLRGLRKSSKTETGCLPFGFRDVLVAEEKGRWWVVGSAWVSGPNHSQSATRLPDEEKVPFQSRLIKLARKFRMNTQLRRTIFCIIMSGEVSFLPRFDLLEYLDLVEDYLDAFEKLLKLGLKDQQEREIIHISFTCCLAEKSYNPYYGFLIKKFCKFHRRFQLTSQYAVWDKLKEAETLTGHQTSNLASLIGNLISDGALKLSVLKVIDLAELEGGVSGILKKILLPMITENTLETLREVFKRMASSKERDDKLFKDGLKLYIHHVLGNLELDGEKKILLRERLSLLEQY